MGAAGPGSGVLITGPAGTRTCSRVTMTSGCCGTPKFCDRVGGVGCAGRAVGGESNPPPVPVTGIAGTCRNVLPERCDSVTLNVFQ